MEASEMVDVLHYFFEEDYLVASTAEKASNVTRFRKNLYKNLYEKDYNYGYDDSQSSPRASSNFESEDDEDFAVEPFDVSSVTKPYVPPTEPMGGTNPFGDLLDGPVG